MSSEYAIKVENLSKCYQIYDNPRDVQEMVAQDIDSARRDKLCADPGISVYAYHE